MYGPGDVAGTPSADGGDAGGRGKGKGRGGGVGRSGPVDPLDPEGMMGEVGGGKGSEVGWLVWIRTFAEVSGRLVFNRQE